MRHIFWQRRHILSGREFLKGESAMWEWVDGDTDLDDVIFEKDDGGPSER